MTAAIEGLDRMLEWCGRVFHVLANLCLGLMLIGTAVTIVLRPLELSFYWIWPWTMQFFVWMSFIGFFVVYRRGKDIAVDFLVLRMGAPAMTATRLIVWQMPVILASQVGVIDGVLTPWGELERYTLSIPLGVSCTLIFINALLDVAKELPSSHQTDPDS
jgi:hypothetical protein